MMSYLGYSLSSKFKPFVFDGLPINGRILRESHLKPERASLFVIFVTEYNIVKFLEKLLSLTKHIYIFFYGYFFTETCVMCIQETILKQPVQSVQ